jgi:predicted MFS family arabinose efflux permease
MLLGIAEGPFLPIALARMASASTPSRTSFNLAFLQQIGAFVLAQGLGPIFLTGLCQHLGWRMTFLVTGLPGLLVALLIWRLQTSGGRSESSQLHPASEEQTPRKDEARGSFLDLLRCRNILVCGGIAGCMGTWILLQMTFLPQYLVKQLGLSSSSMGFIMSMTGISGCVASLVLPLLSNRLGRRPVLVVCTGLGLLMPLSVLVLPAVPAVLMLAVLLGSISFGCSPLYVSIVPREAVPDGLTARAIALVSACSAIVGGTIMPPLAGRLADHFTLPALPLMIAAGAAATACAIACLLRESVPVVLRPALVG